MRLRSKIAIIIPLIFFGAIPLYPYTVIAQTPTPIACGQVMAGSIITYPQVDSYTFEAAAGDSVTIRAGKVSGPYFIPSIGLYAPNGALLVQGSYRVDQRALTATGTYTVKVWDYRQTTGQYLVTWQRLNNPCAPAIGCGQGTSGTTGLTPDVPPWRFYTFTASANDSVTIRAYLTSGTFSPLIELYGPDGTRIVEGNSPLDRQLTLPGTYMLVVRDNSDGAPGGLYNLVWQRLNNPCNGTPIGCGQVLPGSIGAVGELDFYTFEASGGDSVTIRANKVSGTPYFFPNIELYAPNGTYLIGGRSMPIDYKSLPVNGTYTVIMRDYSLTTGQYLLTWQRLNNPCAPAIGCGQGTSDTVGVTPEVPPWRFYTFSASVNDSVTIRTYLTSGNPSTGLELYGPDGSRIGNGNPLDKNLTQAGLYTVVVSHSDVSTGSYNLVWQRLNNPCNGTPIGCGQVLSGSIGAVGQLDFYTFGASAGDSVTIRANKVSGTPYFFPNIELYAPNGTYLIGGRSMPIDYKSLPVSGTYTVIMRDYSLTTGQYLLTWHRINNPCNAPSIACGRTSRGSLTEAAKMDAYTISGAAGDNVVLTLTRTSGGLDPSLELYDSSGTRVAYQYTTYQNQVAITQSLPSGGSYTVFVSDYGNDETGNYELKFQKNNSACPVVTVATPNGNEKVIARSIYRIRWTFTSTQGVGSQEVRLSTDGGQTFPNIIATGLPGNVWSYAWDIPSDMLTNQGRIRVIVTTTSGVSSFDDSDGDFTIFQGVGTIYLYDETHRLVGIIYEDGRRGTYKYDAVGNLLSLTVE
jgi:YD repeat-containing protein